MSTSRWSVLASAMQFAVSDDTWGSGLHDYVVQSQDGDRQTTGMSAFTARRAWLHGRLYADCTCLIGATWRACVVRYLTKWFYTTRLETRTKESNIYASVRVDKPTTRNESDECDVKCAEHGNIDRP